MHTLQRSTPYQGEPAVLHHFTELQLQIKAMEAQPHLERSPPNEVVAHVTEQDETRDILHHTITLSFELPQVNTFTPLALYLPSSDTVWFATDREFERSHQCTACGNPLKHGGWLLPHNSGVAWFCHCIFPGNDEVVLLDILDWWHYVPWWTSLTEKYVNKQRIAPFCSTLLFIAMAHRLISLEGFHKSDMPGATKERLRSLWRGIEGHPIPDDTTLQQMCTDSLHPERWPEATALAEKLIQATLSQPGRWSETVKPFIQSPWIDLRDGYATGILSALPVGADRHVDRHTNTVSTSGFGQPKQRGALQLKLLHRQTMSERKFPAIRYTFTNNAGQHFRWDASLPSAPDLNVSECYVLQATIREHLKQGQGITTLIYHCTGFTPVDETAEEPAFLTPQTIKHIPDKVELLFRLQDQQGRIDGRTHISLSRQWQENEQYYHINTVITWPVTDHAAIIDAMKHAGCDRNTLDKKRDKALLQALEKCAPPNALVGDVKGFWVDDGYTQMGQSYQKETARDGATPSERQWRKPHWFFEQAEAQSHARRLMMGRMISMSTDSATLSCCDLGMRGDPSYLVFLEAARRSGINFLYETDTGRITPLSTEGMSVLHISPEHAPWPTQAHYTLKGWNFLLYPEHSFSNGEPCCEPIPAASILHPHPASKTYSKSLSVRDLTHGAPERSRIFWYHAAADTLTLHYLRMLGARCWYLEDGSLDTGGVLESLPLIPTQHPRDNPLIWNAWMEKAMSHLASSRKTA